MHTVGDDERRIACEQRRDRRLIGFELPEGAPHRRILIGRILQLDDAEWQPVDEQHDVQSARLLPINHGELVGRDPVVVVVRIEIEQARLRAGDRSVGVGVFDSDAADQHAMQRAVARDQSRSINARQLAEGIIERCRRHSGVEPRQRLTQRGFEDDIAIIRVATLGAGTAHRNVRAVQHGVAQALQPCECGLLGYGFSQCLITHGSRSVPLAS